MQNLKHGNHRFQWWYVVLLGLLCMLWGTGAQASEEVAIPKYAGTPVVQIHENVPFFSQSELTTTPFETYSALDELGRCGVAYANICQELMPTEERGEIGSIKPTGWVQNKYPGLVNSEPPYLYNRCHLIGYQLAGENANECNLITGTRSFNVDGMLPYENLVADYVKSTGHHVLYRVTPIYEETNLLANGVLMEAQSVEDAGIGFCVFVYNVQPGVILHYEDGTNEVDPNYTPPVTTQESVTTSGSTSGTSSSQSGTCQYVLNTNTMKFHYAGCSSVGQMSEKNKQYSNASRDEIIAQGYTACKRCHP